jgi:hypothetical protein
LEFHFSARSLAAGKSGGAAAVSAYISGRSTYNGKRLNAPHGPGEVAFGGLELPPGVSFSDAEAMWNAADRAERRKDGSYQMRGGDRRPVKEGQVRKRGVPRIATHADMALPWGTDETQSRRIVTRICNQLIEQHHVGVQWAVHTKEGRIDHVHFLWSSRKLSSKGFGRKARSLNSIACRDNQKDDLKNPMRSLRKQAAEAIEKETGIYWDPRSFEEREIDLVPEPKLDRRRFREEKRRAAREAKETGDKPEPTRTEKLLEQFRAAKERERPRAMKRTRKLARIRPRFAEAKAIRRAFETGVTRLLTSAEVPIRPAPDSADSADVAPNPVNKSRGDFRLLAAARNRVKRAGGVSAEIVSEDREFPGSDPLAGGTTPPALPEGLDPAGAHSKDLYHLTGLPSSIVSPENGPADVAIGTSVVTHGTPDVAQRRAGIDALRGGDADTIHGAEHQGIEGVGASYSGFLIAEQAQEVVLKSLTQAERGTVPGRTSEDPRPDSRETNQALEIAKRASPALAMPSGTATEFPKNSDPSARPYQPSEQGETLVPETPSLADSAGSHTLARTTSTPESADSDAQLVHVSGPKALEAGAQSGTNQVIVPMEGGSETAQAPVSFLVSERPGPVVPSLVPMDPSDPSAAEAVAGTSVQHPATDRGYLRESLEAMEQSGDQFQAATVPSASGHPEPNWPAQDEPFNPIEDENGQRRNPLLQQVAATIIHAFDRVDPVLQDTASILLGVCLDIPAEAAFPIADKIVQWRYVTRAWPDMPPPLSVADCGKVTERIMGERQGGKGDDWMWSWKGLSPHRPPPRPNPGRVKGVGLND